MFREMRRSDRALPTEETKEFLKTQSYGVLSVLGDDDYPYGVPLNYAADDEYIYLHGFLDGHKIDAVINHPKVCFTVFGNTVNLPIDISTNYTSIVAFGTAEILAEDDEVGRQAAFEAITFKYAPKNEASANYITKNKSTAAIIRIKIDHLTGKRRKS